jgi:hypothetical protein
MRPFKGRFERIFTSEKQQLKTFHHSASFSPFLVQIDAKWCDSPRTALSHDFGEFHNVSRSRHHFTVFGQVQAADNLLKRRDRDFGSQTLCRMGNPGLVGILGVVAALPIS